MVIARVDTRDKKRADDGGRTRDLNLGKVPRYQLRYVRISCSRRSAKSTLGAQSAQVLRMKHEYVAIRRHWIIEP